MLETKSLRAWDVVTSVIFIGAGVWIGINVLTTFPLQDKYGGVDAVWYVSPALTPLIISILMTGLGTMLLVTAIKEGGLQTLKENLAHVKIGSSTGLMRFFAATVPILVYVFLDISRVDFFICSLSFMLILMLTFYLEDFPGLFSKLARFYFTGAFANLLFVVFGIDTALRAAVPFSMDIIMLLYLLAFCAYCWAQIKGDAAYREKFWLAVQIGVMADLIIAPIFKFILIVPLPNEGMVTWVFSRFWYYPGIRAFRKAYPLGGYGILLAGYLILTVMLLVIRKYAASTRHAAKK